jgi:hypothetical protein
VYRPQADLQVSATINWVVTRSVVENNPAIRANLPLEEKKEKKMVRISHAAGVTTPTNVKVKRADEHSGTVYISMAKIPGASMYYAQYRHNSADEASWIDGPQSDFCRNLEIKGLTPGEVYQFRVRCFGGGQYSQWSQITTIRVL